MRDCAAADGTIEIGAHSSGGFRVAARFPLESAAPIAASRGERADVVLMDIRMHGVDGLEATRRIAADEDLAGVKVIILTTFTPASTPTRRSGQARAVSS